MLASFWILAQNMFLRTVRVNWHSPNVTPPVHREPLSAGDLASLGQNQLVEVSHQSWVVVVLLLFWRSFVWKLMRRDSQQLLRHSALMDIPHSWTRDFPTHFNKDCDIHTVIYVREHKRTFFLYIHVILLKCSSRMPENRRTLSGCPSQSKSQAVHLTEQSDIVELSTVAC